MGMQKNLLIKQEELRSMAKSILEDLKIIKVCPVCGYYTESEDLTADVYAMATNKAKEEYKIDKDDIKEFCACLKEIFDEAGLDSMAEHIANEH